MPRFHKISIEVEEVAVGAVMRLLHNTPGVVNVSYNMDDISSRQVRSGDRRRAVNGDGRLEASTQTLVNNLLLKSTKPVTSAQAIKALESYERTPSAIYSALSTLRHNNLAIGSSEKGYKLTAQGRKWLTAGRPASARQSEPHA